MSNFARKFLPQRPRWDTAIDSAVGGSCENSLCTVRRVGFPAKRMYAYFTANRSKVPDRRCFSLHGTSPVLRINLRRRTSTSGLLHRRVLSVGLFSSIQPNPTHCRVNLWTHDPTRPIPNGQRINISDRRCSDTPTASFHKTNLRVDTRHNVTNIRTTCIFFAPLPFQTHDQGGISR